jgi:hypothetical protein
MNLIERIITLLLFGMILFVLGHHEKRMNEIEKMHIIKVCPSRDINYENIQ